MYDEKRTRTKNSGFKLKKYAPAGQMTGSFSGEEKEDLVVSDLSFLFLRSELNYVISRRV